MASTDWNGQTVAINTGYISIFSSTSSHSDNSYNAVLDLLRNYADSIFTDDQGRIIKWNWQTFYRFCPPAAEPKPETAQRDEQKPIKAWHKPMTDQTGGHA